MGPRGAPKPGSVSPALFHDEKERLNRTCSTDSRSWFNSQMPYDVLPQNATTESREVRVSNTLHLTRPTEIQNSLALAKPAAGRAVPCRKSKIPQQQNGGGAVSTQIGHAPGRLEAHGQTTVQCRQNEILQLKKNSSKAVLTQIGHEPVGWKHKARQQFSAGKTRISKSRTVTGQFQPNSSMHPVGWKPTARRQFSAGRALCRSSRTIAGQLQLKSGMHPVGWKPTARQQFSAGKTRFRSSRRTVAGQF